MNRINRSIIIFLSVFLSILTVYLYIKEHTKKEGGSILVPLKIEAYRIDRHPLSEADIYLNQRFIGRTDEMGFFLKNMKLFKGESYTLRIERDSGGYVYGPWETRFKVVEEKKRKRQKTKVQRESGLDLEGEFDILTELERAQLGKVSLHEKYHFLAILDGYMFYTLTIVGKNSLAVDNAAVIVNGKEEGTSDDKGIYVVKYSGDAERLENVQIVKKGEHKWMNDIEVGPNAEITIELDKMLLIDLFTFTEYYDVIEGIKGVRVYLGKSYIGKTDSEGSLSYKYTNERGVDGYLELSILYPSGFLPKRLKKTFLITRDLPMLRLSEFAYTESITPPKIAVMPLVVKDSTDPFLMRNAQSLATQIQDLLSFGGAFTLISGRIVQQLFEQFELDIGKRDLKWRDIPLIKKEVDAIIFGEIGGGRNRLNIRLRGTDYTGEVISGVNRKISLRELQTVSENFVAEFKNVFPYEGNITSVNDKIYMNLGRRHGIKQGQRFYGVYHYFDEIIKDYSKKRVAKVKVVEAGQKVSVIEVETLSEGILLEPGLKVKRFRDPGGEGRELPVVLFVSSNQKPLAEANVYIDDHWSGQTDSEGRLAVTLVTNSVIDLLVYKEGYLANRESIRVADETRSLEVSLKSGKSDFSIDSSPRGALVYIDGEYRGTTPITKPIVVPYGFHLLELELSGYKRFKKYILFNDKRTAFTGKESIRMFRDNYGEAEKLYEGGKIEKAVALLETVSTLHPDYRKAMEFLGFIYLKDVMDYTKSIEYYSRVLDPSSEEYQSVQNLFSFYNLGQAYFNEAENLFYLNKALAQYHYMKAISCFGLVLNHKNRLPPRDRKGIFQNSLFYRSVSYQKLYYILGTQDYLSRTHYSWIDYFDFFDKNLLSEGYFKSQYSVAETYLDEVERLKGEK